MSHDWECNWGIDHGTGDIGGICFYHPEKRNVLHEGKGAWVMHIHDESRPDNKLTVQVDYCYCCGKELPLFENDTPLPQQEWPHEE